MRNSGKYGNGRWVRNTALARYLGVSIMTLWRWQHDPGMGFPQPIEIHGIKRTDLDRVDPWMESRAINLIERREAKLAAAT
jgi:hypothetical protein